MCTVSWLHQGGGYELLCNRDERHTRRLARPPRVRRRRGVRFITPADGDAGGSWVGVNEFGLTLCLLNRYDVPAGSARPYTSRGRLVLGLIDCRSEVEVSRRVARMALARFRPFTLLALAAGRPSLVLRWAGRPPVAEGVGEAQVPLTSSSFDTEGVVESRRRHFRQMAAGAGPVTGELLYNFHRSHAPARGAYSTCMHREDAATVSFTWIRVTAGAVECRYQPQAPCSGTLGDPIALPRVQTAFPGGGSIG